MITISNSLLTIAAYAGIAIAIVVPQALADEPKSPPGPTMPRQLFPPGIYPLIPEVEQALRPKDSFKECDNCPEMVVVPAGTFMMGSPFGEPDRNDKTEDPPHSVTIPQAFAVGRFAISFDEWDACLAEGGCEKNRGDDGGFGRGRLPASGINFAAAKSYLAWISRKTGRTYRLPSESEREYFTRAGTTTTFWFGSTVSPQQANYRAGTPYGGGPRGEDSKGPVPVDSYAANGFGLYQVHGNVWEWTEDCFNKRFTVDAPTDGRPWMEGDCAKRMVRGGTWRWSADIMRSGARDENWATTGLSFRVIRTLNGVKEAARGVGAEMPPPKSLSRGGDEDGDNPTISRSR